MTTTEAPLNLPPCGDDHWWAPIPNQMGAYECLLCCTPGYRDLATGNIRLYLDGGKHLRGRMTRDERWDILRGEVFNTLARRRFLEERTLQTFGELAYRDLPIRER